MLVISLKPAVVIFTHSRAPQRGYFQSKCTRNSCVLATHTCFSALVYTLTTDVLHHFLCTWCLVALIGSSPLVLLLVSPLLVN